MRWNHNRTHLGVLSLIIMTTFVTACVKNASKDENPREVAFKELQSQQLSQAQVDGSDIIEIRESSSQAAAELTQIFQFTVEDFRELTVRQEGDIINSECRAESPFIYSMSLTGPDGIEKPIQARRNPELLVPGQYVLQVKMENGALCQNISMNLKVQSTIREDLTFTDNENRGYICDNVQENGTIKTGSRVRINTSPMQIVKYSRLNNGQFQSDQVENETTLCQLDIDSRTECADSLLPASVDSHPLIAVQRNCHNQSQRHQRGFAQLLVSGDGSLKADIAYTCRHKRNNLSLKLENCDQLFNLGEELPIQAGQTDITLRRRHMRIGFEPIYGQLKEGRIPSNLWIGLVKVVKEPGAANYYEPVFPSFYSISKDDLVDGHISITDTNNQINLRQIVQSHKTEDLVLVFSRTPNLRQGLYHIEFSQLCADAGNALVAGNGQSGQENLCE